MSLDEKIELILSRDLWLKKDFEQSKSEIKQLINAAEEKQLLLHNVSKRFSEQDMINAAEYGYNYRNTTSFPEKNFEDNCKNNVRQWLTKYDSMLGNG